jgi:hypothetical protein
MPQGFCCYFILVFFKKKFKVIQGHCYNLYLLNIIKKIHVSQCGQPLQRSSGMCEVVRPLNIVLHDNV